jgi:hypothetical protein
MVSLKNCGMKYTWLQTERQPSSKFCEIFEHFYTFGRTASPRLMLLSMPLPIKDKATQKGADTDACPEWDQNTGY